MAGARVRAAVTPAGGWDALALLDPNPGEALHARVARSLRTAVARGAVPEGARLPGHRRLAAHLGVSRNTLVDALSQLEAEGYLASAPRSGTRVAAPPLAPTAPAPGALPLSSWAQRALSGSPDSPDSAYAVDFRLGQPVPELYPEAAWTSALARRAADPPRGRPDPQGPLETRRALAAYLNAERGARVTPEGLMLTGGTQWALDALARVFLEPGRVAAVEDPTYSGARAALSATGATLCGVPVDERGLRPEVLPGDATLAYLTPGCQYPTTGALSAPRRQAVVAWARQSGALLLEDDYAADLHHRSRPPAVLQGLAPERVVLLGTFSKVLAPVTRSGFLAAPPEIVRVLCGIRTLSDPLPGTLDALALADVLSSGAYARHLRRVRPLLEHRQDVLRQAMGERLPRWDVRPVASGLHLYAALPPDLQESELAPRAELAGVGLSLLGPLSGGTRHPPGVLLAFAHLSPDALRDGVRRLAAVLG